MLGKVNVLFYLGRTSTVTGDLLELLVLFTILFSLYPEQSIKYNNNNQNHVQVQKECNHDYKYKRMQLV